MASINIDHKILGSYYSKHDVITKRMYEKNVTKDGWLTRFGNNGTLILRVIDVGHIILNFGIKSEHISTGCINVDGTLISSFHIVKGEKIYPHLIMLRGFFTTLILDKSCITEVTVSTVNFSNCDIMKNHYLSHDKYAHRIVKVNDFSPNIIYHNLVVYGYKSDCSFCEREIVYNVDYGPNNINGSVTITKINAISYRVIQLLNRSDNSIIRDILIFIGIIMYHVV